MAQRRFIRRGVSKFFFAAAINDIQNVTRAEIDAATNLSEFIREVAGWGLENNSVATPDMGSDFEGSIPGSNTANDSSFTFYEDLDSELIETLLPQNTVGFVLIMRKGDKPGSNSLDVFPVRVAVKGNDYSSGNDPAQFQVRFNITSKPALDRPIPAIAGQPPVLTSALSPAGSPTAGGEQIIMTGTGLSTVTAVKVDGVAIGVQNWILVSDTKIVFNSPAKAAGTYPVVATNANGDSNPRNLVYS